MTTWLVEKPMMIQQANKSEQGFCDVWLVLLVEAKDTGSTPTTPTSNCDSRVTQSHIQRMKASKRAFDFIVTKRLHSSLPEMQIQSAPLITLIT